MDNKLPSGNELTALDDAFRDDPYAILRRLRECEPVHHDTSLNRWFITDHHLVKDVLHDRQFCVDARKAAEKSYARLISDTGQENAPPPSMLGLDDPDHRRLRSFVAKAFSPTAVEAMRGAIEDIVESILETLRGRQGFDLISEFANPVPFRVLARMLGVEQADEEDFRSWANAKVQVFDPTRSPSINVSIGKADAALRQYFGLAIAARRTHPKDDLLSDLVRANDGGETLSEVEIVTMCNLLIIAGVVTTADLIGNGVHCLLNSPGDWQKLRKKPELIVAAVEEILRFDSPVIQTGRIATRDVQIGGCFIEKGASLSLSLGAANRDPNAYEDPHEFNIERVDLKHQSFGGGVHLCLGAALARLEAQVAILRLVQAFPFMQLAPGPVVRKKLPVLNGRQQLMVLTGGTR